MLAAMLGGAVYGWRRLMRRGQDFYDVVNDRHPGSEGEGESK